MEWVQSRTKDNVEGNLPLFIHLLYSFFLFHAAAGPFLPLRVHILIMTKLINMYNNETLMQPLNPQTFWKEKWTPAFHSLPNKLLIVIMTLSLAVMVDVPLLPIPTVFTITTYIIYYFLMISINNVKIKLSRWEDRREQMTIPTLPRRETASSMPTTLRPPSPLTNPYISSPSLSLSLTLSPFSHFFWYLLIIYY